MQRCLQLAKLGAGFVAPNPMVGSVLVYDNRIVGEGYHKQYGEAHAEVNCISSVKEDDKHLIAQSVLYISLEPCAHFGKTPPCADLIVGNKIPKVVIGCRDPFNQVNGKGIEKLMNAGVDVITGIMESECKEINKRFFTFHTKQRPYIILKWAQSKNHKIANADLSKVAISNAFTNRLVHKWRSEEAAIMVGANTAFNDNPSLNVRHWTGHNPVRLVVDLSLRLPQALNLFNKKQRTIVFNTIKHEEQAGLMFYKIEKERSIVSQMLNACMQLNIQSILIEGGTTLLQSFMQENIWDEARVIENTQLMIDNGLAAPALHNWQLAFAENIFTDNISYYYNA